MGEAGQESELCGYGAGAENGCGGPTGRTNAERPRRGSVNLRLKMLTPLLFQEPRSPRSASHLAASSCRRPQCSFPAGDPLAFDCRPAPQLLAKCLADLLSSAAHVPRPPADSPTSGARSGAQCRRRYVVVKARRGVAKKKFELRRSVRRIPNSRTRMSSRANAFGQCSRSSVTSSSTT